jgi:hypothetical protein
MKANRSDHKMDATLAELIATISDVAFEYSDDTLEAYDLARQVLVEILKGAPLKGAIVGQDVSTSKFLH